MSIATEITRLQNAKADIKSSIEEKGVTVPSTATLDEYSELIDSIPAGGGSGGTSNYNALTNKPKINNVELVGNKSLNDLGIVTLDEFYKAFPTDTASGAVASFTDGADNLPLKSLVVNIDPVQDLSHGDPSPENVCPISGWTGAQVVRTGNNLLPMEIQVSWQTEAGTVYGGKLDVLTGKLTVDMAMPSLDEGTIYRDNGTYKIWRVNNLPRSVSVSGGRAISNITKSFGNVSSTALETKIQFPSGNQQILFASIPTDFNITDVQVAYELATPIEIQLDPHEINTLLGVNNIWADTGDTEVEYRADTKLYINKMIGDAETISTRLASGGRETALYEGAINPIETNIPLEEEGVEYEKN